MVKPSQATGCRRPVKPKQHPETQSLLEPALQVQRHAEN
ncbi:hypothetical protein PC116_g20989 [Phytophthora cactorum]|nr:hypothetical protein PC123_g18232 [Phytophthora cactorum]KAG4230726.1 hypothetical protein PC116_g20989 [Phytophthora cactorum]